MRASVRESCVRSDGATCVSARSSCSAARTRTYSLVGKASAGLDAAPHPYDLRHSLASLLLAEGRTVHYVAAQLGHSPALTLSTYGHLIAEYADAGPINAEEEIATARAAGYPMAGGDRTLGVVACVS